MLIFFLFLSCSYDINGQLICSYSFSFVQEWSPQRHMALDAIQRAAMRDLLALATALGATSILPPLSCSCDRYWYSITLRLYSDVFSIVYDHVIPMHLVSRIIMFGANTQLRLEYAWISMHCNLYGSKVPCAPE